MPKKQIDPRKRLTALAATERRSLRFLSMVIGRNEPYLQQFVHRGSPRLLASRDRHFLAKYFGIDERELGAARGQRTPVA